MIVDYANVIDSHMASSLGSINGRNDLFAAVDTGQAVFKECFGLQRTADERVVVHIEEMLRQSFNAMDVHLNSAAVEGREAIFRHEFPMGDKVQLRVIQVKERRNLPAGDEVDCTHPGDIVFDGTEPVWHQPPVAEAVDGVGIIQLTTGIFCLLNLPLRITSVDP